jgi:hypothetical protein
LPLESIGLEGLELWSVEDWACYNDAFEEVCYEVEVDDVTVAIDMCDL